VVNFCTKHMITRLKLYEQYLIETKQNPRSSGQDVHLYMPELLCHKTEFIDGMESYSEAFDPTLMDRYPRYDTGTHLCDIPPTSIQQREIRFTLKASRSHVSYLYLCNNLDIWVNKQR